jgi:hypothetical protein
MTHLLTLFVAMTFLLPSPVRPAAQATPWGTNLTAWVGKYPTAEGAARPKRLLAIPAVRQSLNTLLSRADLRLLDSVLAVEKPVAQVERFVVVEQCMPHDCPSVHAMVVLDTQERRLWVGIFEHTGRSVSTRWYGSTDHTLLPEAILESFRRGHEPE